LDFLEIPLVAISSAENGQGTLNVFEFDTLPFNPKRLFTVSSVQSSSTRGRHAHRVCRQLIACISGEIELICIYGENYEEKIFHLTPASNAVLIEPGVWAEQTYKTSDSVAIVFCSHKYDEADYIREYEEFKRYIKI